jgi:hypothetical protein
MQIALLFDELAQHRYHAGHTARTVVLRSGVLQACGRLVTVRSGTVLLSHARPEHREELAQAAFFADLWSHLDQPRVLRTFQTSKIFAWAVNNVDRATASSLHEALQAEPSYLGAHAIDLARPSHWALYRRSLPLVLRIWGNRCSAFFRVVDGDDRDTAVYDDLKSLGFDEVEWEDLGLRETIVDDFDTPEHFSRLGSLRDVLKLTQPGGVDDADELLVLLDDLSPRLAETLAVASESFLNATSDEHLAQVGLSVRRYLEQLADFLFPARQGEFNGRDVTKPKVKNRLRSYIETVGTSQDHSRLADASSRLIDAANQALHASSPRDYLRDLLGDVARVSVGLLMLAPHQNRRPYDAYWPRMREFLLSARG